LKTKTLTILDAIRDDNLFKPYFGKDYRTFAKWFICLRAIYGLPIRTEWGRKVFRQCTGRDARKIPKQGFQTVLILTGRRSGKSKIAAVIAAYSAALAGLESRLSAGEQGLIAVISPTRKQGRIVRDYCRALFESPMLAAEIIKERSQDVFTLRNGNRLEILASDYRSVRGYSTLAVVVDEVCFMGLEESSKIRTDTQLVNSMQPALATTHGKLIAISSPYARRGWAFETHKKYFGQDSSQDILVWNAASKYMNPKLSQAFLDRMKAEDLQSYKSEFLAEFRDDVANFVSLELVESLVIKNRHENIPRPGVQYNAFVDLSGGRSDASALAIGHRDEKKKIILDCLDWHPSPNDPHAVVASMAKRLQEWNIKRVTGDAYAAEFASRAFQDRGITYSHCEKTKGVLYAELLPILCAGEIELLDHKLLIKQLAGLERRTRSGGRDVIDSPPKGHDDLSNVVAGVAFLCNKKAFVYGAVKFN
jgi:hypothetical protein